MEKQRAYEIPIIDPIQDNFTIVSNTLIRSNLLKPQQKIVAIYLLSHHQKYLPTQEQICNDLSITRPTLNKALKALKAQGFLNVVKVKLINNANLKVNQYQINQKLIINKLHTLKNPKNPLNKGKTTKQMKKGS